jgi:hypothetical protein
MDEAAPAAAGAGAEKRRSRFRRVPPSVFLTLLGIGLTAWLLPAFTRQWEDRQKAHEFSAALAEQMASSTAQIMERTRAKLYHRTQPITDGRRTDLGFFAPAFDSADTAWGIASARIEASLLASYSPDLARRWLGLSELITGWIAWFDNTGHRWEPADQPDKSLAWQAATTKVTVYSVPQTAFTAMREFANMHDDLAALVSPSGAHKQTLSGLDRSRLVGFETLLYDQLDQVFLSIEAGIARDLVDAHVRGYSTSTRDLLHDLIP